MRFLRTGTALAVLLGAVALAAAQSPVPSQIQQGAALYVKHCAPPFPRPIWGAGNDTAKFGNGRGLIEYIQLLMPFDDPLKLNDADKLSIVAFMLVQGGQLKESELLTDAKAEGISLR
jgi:hypothetical protein